MKPNRLAAIRRRAEQATPGWSHEGHREIFARIPGGRPNGEGIAVFHVYANRKLPFEQDVANASFAAHARQDIPDLLDYIEYLEQELIDERGWISE